MLSYRRFYKVYHQFTENSTSSEVNFPEFYLIYFLKFRENYRSLAPVCEASAKPVFYGFAEQIFLFKTVIFRLFLWKVCIPVYSCSDIHNTNHAAISKHKWETLLLCLWIIWPATKGLFSARPVYTPQTRNARSARKEIATFSLFDP